MGQFSVQINMLLNHTDGSADVTSQVYVQYSYDFEKKRAMDVWEYILDQIVTCKSVDDVPDLETMRQKVAESGLLHS